MEYRKATIEEAQVVCDIAAGRIDVLIIDGKIIGTGSRTDNHVTRVYVLPEQEGKGFGSVIMDRLEDEIMRKEKGLKVSGGQNE